MLFGLATAASGTVGWLLGPSIGNAMFGFKWRHMRAQIAAVGVSPCVHLMRFTFRAEHDQIFAFQADVLINDLVRHRKIETFTPASSATVSIHQASHTPTLYRITTARRLAASRNFGIG